MDRFQLIRKLSSQGACGTVLIAKDLHYNSKNNNNKNNNMTNNADDSQVVVKQLPAHDIRSMTERRVMRNLRHNNIVRFLDSWFTVEEVPNPDLANQQQQQQQQQGNNNNGNKQQQQQQIPRTIRQKTLNIAMEYVKGGDLRQAIRQRRSEHGVGKGFPEAIIRSWIVQMCSALYYCHSQHIIHRDLKAENILISDASSGPQDNNNNGSSISAPIIKIADFGFAKELAESNAFATTRLGTPHSLPPEIYDHTPYNNRADMWCLGVILYEIMTLSRPFLGNTMDDLFQSIMRSEPLSAEKVTKGIYSKELYDLQKRLLSKNPMLRPSAREVLSFDWLAPLVEKIRHFPMSDEQRLRDQAAWDRISVQAEHQRTVIMELYLPNTTVNVRDHPSFNTPNVVMQLHPGDFIEVLEEVSDRAGVKWLRTTRGFCIKMTPMNPSKDMFRRIAEWRVRRPSSSRQGSSSPPGVNNNNNSSSICSNNNSNDRSSPNKVVSASSTGGGGSIHAPASPGNHTKDQEKAILNQQQQQQQNPSPNTNFGGPVISPTTDSPDDIQRCTAEAAKNALECQIKADQMLINSTTTSSSSKNNTNQNNNNKSSSTNNNNHNNKNELLNRFLITSLIENGIPEDLLGHLLEKYNELAAPLDDMPWTLYCNDALRPLRLIPWIPVLRWVAILVTGVDNNNNHNNNTSNNNNAAASSSSSSASPSTIKKKPASSNNNNVAAATTTSVAAAAAAGATTTTTAKKQPVVTVVS